MRHRITIKTPDDGRVNGTRVYLDDVEVEGVSAIRIAEMVSGGVVRVSLDIFPLELFIEGGAEVERITKCPECKVEMGRA